MSLMELWDLITENGDKTGGTIERGQPLPAGLYHLAVHYWPRDEHGRYLIQKRAKGLRSLPGIWAETGGSVLAGETSLQAVQREVMEELGLVIEPDGFEYMQRLVRPETLTDFWTGRVSSGFRSEFKPTDEVDEIAFKYPHEITEMIERGAFHRFVPGYRSVVGI